MKKILLVIAVMLSFHSIMQAQGNNNASSCYYDQSTNFWKISLYQYGSKQLDKCEPSYNCHGFAIAYLKGNCSNTLGWNRPINTQVADPCPSQYWLSQGSQGGIRGAADYRFQTKYFKVNNEADADLVYWASASIGGNHTAVKDKSYTNPGGYKYISKYGADGPLVGHNLNSSWYHVLANQNSNFNMSAPEFWAYITGFSNVGTTSINQGATTTVSFPNKSGVTYNWSVSNSNVAIISGQNTNQVTVRGDYGGSVVLTGTLGSTHQSNKSESYSVTINVQSANITGNYTDANSSNVVLQTVNTVSSGIVTTTVGCGPNASFYWVKNSGNASFTQNQGLMTLNMPTGSYVNFTVYAVCNGVSTSRSITYVQNGLGGWGSGGPGIQSIAPVTDSPLLTPFKISTYPNPATEELQLQTGINVELEMQIVEQSTGKVRKTGKVCDQTNINIQDLKSGVYIVRLSHQGKIVKTQRIIVNND